MASVHGFSRPGSARPSGLLGRIGGWLMARGNAGTERHLVKIADLRPDDVVLVLGFGPASACRRRERDPAT